MTVLELVAVLAASVVTGAILFVIIEALAGRRR